MSAVLLYPFKVPYWNLLASCGERIFNLVEPTHPVELALERWVILVKPAEMNLGAGGHAPAISVTLVSSNVLLTLALLLATPRLSVRRRIKVAALGMFILFLSHVANIVFEVKMHYITWYASLLGIRYGAFEAQTIKWICALFQYFRAQLFPFLIWGTLCYKDLFLSLGTQPAKRVGKNQTCPCGSGAKFKHCCGKNVDERQPGPN
ncbi:MAG: SEC-C domain-containing protein [Deltaproteobacteria bacterium]|nr:SEC-C domain-containing protein [Deltaproteobacteria bacterium]